MPPRANTEQLRKEMRSAVKRPWPDWMRNLLTQLIKAYFPTIDAAGSVRVGEILCRKPSAISRFKFNPDQLARTWGHVSALSDYYVERLNSIPLSDRALAELFAEARDEAAGHRMFQEYVRDAGFQKRVALYREFSYGYSNTFTDLGELRGGTDATSIYLRILKWSMIWFVTRPPRTVAELHRWIRSESPRPKLSRIEELRRKEREAADLKRFQQICDRLGLNLRSARRRRSKK